MRLQVRPPDGRQRRRGGIATVGVRADARRAHRWRRRALEGASADGDRARAVAAATEHAADRGAAGEPRPGARRAACRDRAALRVGRQHRCGHDRRVASSRARSTPHAAEWLRMVSPRTHQCTHTPQRLDHTHAAPRSSPHPSTRRRPHVVDSRTARPIPRPMRRLVPLTLRARALASGTSSALICSSMRTSAMARWRPTTSPSTSTG